MIKSFSVKKLFGKEECNINFPSFHPDLNILTGKNGSGKTTLLKLMWYMLSGNIERIPREISFESAELRTDIFQLQISMAPKEAMEHAVTKCVLTDLRDNSNTAYKVTNDEDDQTEELDSNIQELSQRSIFFPTFRRIEGGFALRKQRGPASRYRRPGAELEEAISSYSKMMSSGGHRFVASILTNDIELLLTRRYADISEKTNNLHQELSTGIENLISGTPSWDKDSAPATLDKISKFVKNMTGQREELLRPFQVFSDLITHIFKEKGIKIDVFEFRGAKDAISSALLSAGEKQMLSFLCYNAFATDCPIFIDEPEISLHVDWQRLLFPTLLQQATTNQFIISTHSPFIYSKYPEKELVLDPDKG